MAKLDYEQKLNSKPYRFFDLVYRLVVCNVLTIICFCTVIFAFPSIVACISTLKKENSNYNVFKAYFANLFAYLKKSILIGLILILLYGIFIYAIYFYSKVEGIDGKLEGFLNLFVNSGFVVCLVGFVILVFLTSHLPYILITFSKFSIGFIFKTSLYVTFRYILTTIILFILSMVSIITFICCIIRFQILAIWMLIGITLPLFLQLKISYPVYTYFSKIDYDKIINSIDEEEGEENE